MVKSIWDSLKFSDIEHACHFCGQTRSFSKEICDECVKHQFGVVLSVCRNLLTTSGKRKVKPAEDGEIRDMRELSLNMCLDEFPFVLAEQTCKHQIVLNSAGVWFAHLVAYTNAAHIKRKAEIEEILKDPVYEITRKRVFDLLRNPGAMDKAAIELFLDLYTIPAAPLDARRVIKEMLYDLEEAERIRIEYPKTACMGCGTKIKLGEGLCSECRQDEQLSSRFAILSGQVSLLAASRSKGATRQKSMGMHIRKDKS